MLRSEICWTAIPSNGSIFINYLIYDSIIIPIVSTGLYIIGHWICLLVKGRKSFIIIPVIIFGYTFINVGIQLLFNKSEISDPILKQVEEDVLWYCCAIISLILTLVCYILIISRMKYYADDRYNLLTNKEKEK